MQNETSGRTSGAMVGATPSASAAGLMDLLLRSGEALRNWRALATLMGTGLVTFVVVGSLASSGNLFLILLGLLIAFVTLSIGVSATGILLMDQAMRSEPRPIATALVDGTFAALRLLVLTLIGLVVALVVVIAVSILLVVCKIPGLGGLLYAVVLPVSALTVAFVYAGLYFVYSMAGAAVWSGASIRQAVAALYAIIAHRLVESALGVVLHSLLMMLIGGIVAGFIFAGVGIVVGLSSGILGASMGLPDVSGWLLGGMGGVGAMRGLGGMGSFGGLGDMAGTGLFYGGMLGFGVLMAIVVAVLMSMMILGLNRLYLHLTADLDLEHAEREVARRMDEARERARTMQEEARRRADEMRKRTQADATVVVKTDPVRNAEAAPAKVPCANCQVLIDPADAFCEHCGHPQTPR